MTKAVVTLLLFIASSFTFAQHKLLTIQDALNKGRSTLAPKRLQALGFIPGSNKVAYIEKNELIIINAETGKTVSTTSTVGLNKDHVKASIDTVSAFDGLLWQNENQFYFRNTKGEWLHSLDKKTTVKSERKLNDFTLENLDIFKEGEIFAYVNGNR